MSTISAARLRWLRNELPINGIIEELRVPSKTQEGIFRFSPNAMYVFGFVWLWLPGLFLQSIAALAVALFSHLYIWVHYACTERPDMRRIYGAEGHHGS